MAKALKAIDTSFPLPGFPMSVFLGGVRCASRACFYGVNRKRRKGAKKVNPRKLVIASQVKNVFAQNNFVAVYHYNSLDAQQWDSVRLKLAQSGIKIKIFPSKISMKSLQETRYRHVSPLFRGCTAVAFAKEPSAAKQLLSVTKAETKLHLLGGVVEDEIMTPLGLQDYADLPPLEVMHQTVLGTLSQTQMMLRMYLESTPQKLTRLLAQVSQPDTADTDRTN